MSIPHKHCNEIKAWADGAEIQYKVDGVWEDTKTPSWCIHTQYRVKPPVINFDWSNIDPRWNYIARDSDGEIFLYGEEPYIRMGYYWSALTSLSQAITDVFIIPNYDKLHWEESILARSED